ncbi:hypothetical protein ABPG72_018528 [Tetrahymena utriculariae]
MSEEREKQLKQEENDLITQIDRLERGIVLRENQINSMKSMMIEVQAQVSEAKMKCDQSDLQIIQLNNQIKMKDQDLKQVLRDKELLFSKLQTLERECDKVKESIEELKHQI